MRVLASVLIFLAGTVFFAECSVGAEPRAEDHDALRSLMGNVVVAMNNRDVPMLMNNLAKDFSVTTVEQQTFTSAKELEDYFEKTFKSTDSIVTDLKISPQADVLTKFTGVNSGFSYGKNLETYTMKDGRKVDMESRWTAALVKENDQWKIAAIHAGVNFLKNPVVEKLGSVMLKTAILSFLCGAFVVFLALFVLRRARAGRN